MSWHSFDSLVNKCMNLLFGFNDNFLTIVVLFTLGLFMSIFLIRMVFQYKRAVYVPVTIPFIFAGLALVGTVVFWESLAFIFFAFSFVIWSVITLLTWIWTWFWVKIEISESIRKWAHRGIILMCGVIVCFGSVEIYQSVQKKIQLEKKLEQQLKEKFTKIAMQYMKKEHGVEVKITDVDKKFPPGDEEYYHVVVRAHPLNQPQDEFSLHFYKSGELVPEGEKNYYETLHHFSIDEETKKIKYKLKSPLSKLNFQFEDGSPYPIYSKCDKKGCYVSLSLGFINESDPEVFKKTLQNILQVMKEKKLNQIGYVELYGNRYEETDLLRIAYCISDSKTIIKKDSEGGIPADFCKNKIDASKVD